MCGATQAQQNLETEQASYYQTLQNQATQEFGQASEVFNDLYSSMALIVAAGINQQGFSPTELQNLNTEAITGTSQAYTGAAQSLRQQEAAAGGSNFVLSGATLEANEELNTSAAGQQASELSTIQQNNYATGRQNYFAAAGDLAAATGTYNPATGAAGAANTGGSDAASTANQIAEQNNSWMSAVSGALGGVAGGIASGGMSNLGKGVGFFG